MAGLLFTCSWPCVCLLWRNVYSSPLPVFEWVFVVVVVVEFFGVFINTGYQSLT